jgi:murein DD-endopeptidase MepM/ murein hydrolase activator NlpD
VRKFVICLLTFVMLASVVSLGASYAGQHSDLNKVNDQISQTKKQLQEGKKKEQQLNQQIKDLEKQISAVENEISDIRAEINATIAKIETAKQNLAQVEAEMNDQNDSLKKRLRAMYKNGESGLLEILLGSESITDFMSNMDMVQKIFDYDIEVLKTIKAQHEKIQHQKKELEKMQDSLIAKRNAEAAKQNTLQANRGQVANLKSQVAQDNQQLAKQIDALNAEADRLVEEIRRLQGSGSYDGSKFAWPSASSTRVTSEYGYRIHPVLKVKKLHTGMDIGAPAGTKVLAANSGTVIKAGWNNSYGYVIMIDHGDKIVTLYAHNTRLHVKTGDVVARGQHIADVGSTGMSTGPHIHFEVRVNGQYQNPRNWL